VRDHDRLGPLGHRDLPHGRRRGGREVRRRAAGPERPAAG
jgi:hypothetical protein